MLTAQQFLQVADWLPDALLLLTRDGLIVAANRSATAELALAPGQPQGRRLADLVAEPADTLAPYLRACSRSSGPLPGALRLRAADGGIHACRCVGGVCQPRSATADLLILLRFIRGTARPSQFKVLGDRIDQLGREILERRRAEEELRLSDRRYRSLELALAEMVWTTGPHGEMTSFLHHWTTLTGQTSGQASGDGWLDALHPDDREEANRRWKTALATQTAYEAHFRVRHADARWRHLLARGQPVLDEGGLVKEWVGIILDITNLKQAEEALRASEERLRLALDAGRMGIWVWDIRANRSVLSPREYELLGLPVGDGEVDTGRFFERVHPDDLGELRRSLDEVLARGSDLVQEFRIVRADAEGDIRWLAGAGRLYRDAAGQPVQLISSTVPLSQDCKT